ncbi:hypothetical protein D9M68_274450 [compost metagenome]
MLDIALLFFSICSYGFGKINDTLPVTLSNILICACFIYHIAFSLRNRVIYYNNYLLALLAFILFGAIINNTYGSLFEKAQFIIYYLVYSLTIIAIVNKHGAEKLLRLYVVVCFSIAALGLVQSISHAAGISVVNELIRTFSENKNTSMSGGFIRSTSIASEPALLGLYLLPAIVLSISRLFGIDGTSSLIRRREVFVILASALSTLSLIVYIYLLAISLFFLIKQRRPYLCIIVAVFFFSIYEAAYNIESISSRLGELTGPSSIGDSQNLSVIAFSSNLNVTMESLKSNLLIGTGIASHAEKYENLVYAFYSHTTYGVGLNKDDAASMILRTLSEFGVIGFIIFYSAPLLYFFRQKYSTNNLVQEVFLISFFLYGLRYGSINTAIFWFYLCAFLGSYSKKYGFKAYRF